VAAATVEITPGAGVIRFPRPHLIRRCIMAETKQHQDQDARKNSQGDQERPEKNVRVFENGREESGDPLRDRRRHSGIPLGSDPRE